MPRFNLIQTNFTAGEISPRMYGRVDVTRYNNGAKRIDNCIPVIHGGCPRRPGLAFNGRAKHDDKIGRLIPYIFNVDQAYQLELGDVSLRFWNADGSRIDVTPGTAYEVATPWSEGQLSEIDFCQGADTMFLFHPDIPTQRLQRFGLTDWRLQPMPWITEPFDELGDRFPVALTLSSSSPGTGVTVTAASATWMPADVGRDIEWEGGLARITGYTSATVVTVTTTYAFPSVNAPAGAWLLNASPQSTVTPSAADPVGATITMTTDAATWRASDVGKFVILNGGLVRIISIVSSTNALAEIRAALATPVAVVPNAWALCRSQWGQEFGYPRTGTLHKQRLWVGGSPGLPDTVWMSRIGIPYDFEIGTDADSGYSFGIYSDQANTVRHLSSIRALAALSDGGEFTIRPGGDGGITPTNIDIENQSAYGCNDVSPVRVGNELLFVNRNGRKIRALAADRFDASTFAAPDITALAEHITAPGIVDMEAQAEPEDVVWCVRADGAIATCTLDRDNDVVAWARQTTDGAFESVSVIPYNREHVVWVIVRREVDGELRRSVEMFRPDRFTDSGVLVEDDVAFDTIGNLAHLEGKTVAVRADGKVMPDEVVTGGQIQISRPANAVEVGLPFVPLIEMMTAEVQGPAGSSMGLQQRTAEVTLMVKDTIGAEINGRQVPFQGFGEQVLDHAVEPFTGLKTIEQLGFARGTSDLVIRQPQPLPFHVLAVIRKFEVNSG